MGHIQTSYKRENYSVAGLSQETREILNIHLKNYKKEEPTKPKVSRKKEIIKSEKMNKTDSKKISKNN